MSKLNKSSVAMYVFNPFINDSRVLKEAKSISNSGYDVAVIAHLDENLKDNDNIDSISIKRFSFLNRKATRGFFSKLKAYVIYIFQSVKYTKDFDILHCNDLNTLPIGVIIKLFFNKNSKIIYDAHEYETEVIGLKGIKKRLVQLLEKYLIKYADKVITVSDSIANEYSKLYNISKPLLVLNTPALLEFDKKDIFRQTLNISKEKIIFLYQGGLSRGRGIDVMLQTFKQIDDNKSVIVFMGYGVLEYEIKKAQQEYDNIYFHKAVSSDILLDYTSSADFGISLIEDSCLSYRYCLPNKMFEYIMAEIPIIVSNLYEMSKIVNDNHIGIVAQDNSKKGLENAISEAFKLDKDRLKVQLKEVKNFYNWEAQEKVLFQTYEELKI